MLRRIFPALFAIVAFYSSCSKDATAPKYDFAVPVECDTSALTWHHGIEAMIRTNCSYSPNTGCHFTGEGNYDFTSYEVVADRIRSGRFTERILLSPDHALSMPPQGYERDSCQFAKLISWINNGFPEN